MGADAGAGSLLSLDTRRVCSLPFLYLILCVCRNGTVSWPSREPAQKKISGLKRGKFEKVKDITGRVPSGFPRRSRTGRSRDVVSLGQERRLPRSGSSSGVEIGLATHTVSEIVLGQQSHVSNDPSSSTARRLR